MKQIAPYLAFPIAHCCFFNLLSSHLLTAATRLAVLYTGVIVQTGDISLIPCAMLPDSVPLTPTLREILLPVGTSTCNHFGMI